MKVQITEEDIRDGLRYSPRGCAVARAMRRATGREVNIAGEWYAIGGGPVDRRLPERIFRFVRHFDAGDHVEPCEFEVEI